MQTIYKADDGVEFAKRHECVVYEQQKLGFCYLTNNGIVPDRFEDTTIIWIQYNGLTNFQNFLHRRIDQEHLDKNRYEDINASGIYFLFDIYEKFMYIEPDELKILANFYIDHRKDIL